MQLHALIRVSLTIDLAGVIYSSVGIEMENVGYKWLDAALSALLHSIDGNEKVESLWKLQFYHLSEDEPNARDQRDEESDGEPVVYLSPPSSTDLAFDDGVLRDVRQVWQKLSGEIDGFMQFEEREASNNDDNDE